MRLNNKGYSFTEIAITLGVMSIMALGTAALVSNFSMTARSSSVLAVRDQIADRIHNIALSPVMLQVNTRQGAPGSPGLTLGGVPTAPGSPNYEFNQIATAHGGPASSWPPGGSYPLTLYTADGNQTITGSSATLTGGAYVLNGNPSWQYYDQNGVRCRNAGGPLGPQPAGLNPSCPVMATSYFTYSCAASCTNLEGISVQIHFIVRYNREGYSATAANAVTMFPSIGTFNPTDVQDKLLMHSANAQVVTLNGLQASGFGYYSSR